ncbi:DUF2975 domain-containing protein [Saccharospirillum impatiens]|uniref:DUF2975 domain-containing protein n=1 Tax=Saccharospirillum impatiens TaxID=169438 RepID=UPI000416BCDB|nr:DUF2975 domain-containing protein [Saccharospirillum impatiens]
MTARVLKGVVNLVLGLALGFLVVAAGILLGAPLLDEPLLSQWPVVAAQPGSDWQASAANMEAALAIEQGVLRIEHFGYGWHWALRVLDLAISGTLVLAGLWRMRRFIGEVCEGLSFTPGSVSRLRWIGLILVVFPLWQALRDTLWHGLLVRQLPDLGLALVSSFQTPNGNGFQLQFSIDWGFAVTGLLLLVVAEAFREGVALREESEEII